ncbi:glycine--tRNA ligase subunit beta [Listeria ilorinensis]|uniref:glycine--tRNA ligase subunit beta n=1 Tax=Listeria ilorinensis TaxID=2867439 RepID=UPI001EF6DB9D|nr:glycine--tRNA ligase subunit beta [Listeria ilorinensis]
MSKDLLLEIGLEEMPAQYVSASVAQLRKRLEDWLDEERISYGSVKCFSTPRRLAVLVQEVAVRQADRVEEAKGPAKKIAQTEEGEWSKAALGFARSQGVSPEDFTFRAINGTEYLYIKKEIKGAATSERLKELDKVVTGMTFPVSMHWAAYNLRYIRPIKWLIALYGEEVIPFEITNVSTDRTSRGHRFLGSEAVIDSPLQYEEKLLEQFVVADSEARKAAICEQIEEIATVNGWKVPLDEDLLEEVNNLVEYPTVLDGRFEEKYLELPEEILITSMKEHQRYFPVFDQDDQLTAHFITVRNGNHEHLDTVVRGNEKVLRARLSDADFFYQEDLKIPISDAIKKLSAIVFHEKLGTLTEKMKRVQKIALLLADYLNWTEADKEDIKRVTDIYKFDLVTNIVGEFPELQGIMGEKYALLQGEKPAVAQAIREHYLPISADGVLPESDLGSLLAIADKLETVISFFCVNIVPTGSADPFGLRRSTFGVMRIIQANKWNLPLMEILSDIVDFERKEGFNELPSKEVFTEARMFIQNRLRVILQDHEIRPDIIDAVIGGNPNMLPQIIDRAKLLDKHADDDWFRPTIEALTRVVNISKKYQEHAEIDPDLFENEYEHQLFDALEKLRTEYPTMKIIDRLRAFTKLRPIIDAYFDNTLVMSDNEELRNNRLALLFELSTFIKEFAQMDEINVK